MTQRVLGPRGGRRRLRLLLLLPLAAIAALVVTFSSSGAVTVVSCDTASHLTGSTFEIDTNANLKVDDVDCIDWLNPAGTAMRSGVVTDNDRPSGSGDDAFGQGTAENDATPTVVSGSIPPNKSDLKVFGLYQETAGSAKFLELFWSRVQNPSGTTNMDFELNQKFCDTSATPTNCATNGVTPARTSGDKLITYDLSKGGTTPTISIRTWNGSVWGTATVISGTGGTALGSVNTSAIMAADAGGIGAEDPYTFGEVALAFSALFPSGGTCGTFGSAYLKSRSSDSFTAELKDFIAPKKVTISNCTGISTTLSATSVAPGGMVHDSATLSGATSTAGGTVTYTVYSNNTCTAGARDAGTKTVTNGVVPNSNDLTFSTIGTFYWQAVYSGDINNGGSTSTCTDEVLTVTKSPSSINTTQKYYPNDSATVTGSGASVTFELFGPYAAAVTPDCLAANLVFSETVAQTAGSAATTNYPGGAESSAVTASGTYAWKVSLPADTGNFGRVSACGQEKFVLAVTNDSSGGTQP